MDIKCKCGEDKKIQVDMFGDSGYSNWTVLESGECQFKCHSCGAWAQPFRECGSGWVWNRDADKDIPSGNNKINNFILTCDKCSGNDFEYFPQDVDQECEDNMLKCKKCGEEFFYIKNIMLK